MRNRFFVVFLFLGILSGKAQEGETLRLDREEIETLFLKNNLALIIERYNVSMADAAIAQAKLWDNPSLAVSGINPWSTQAQQNEIQDRATSSFLRHTQASVELSQLIRTANKRGKLIKRESVSKEMAVQEFEDVLRGLKAELRNSIYSIHYYQAYFSVLTNQHLSVSRLVEAYNKQTLSGNIAKSELLRLQAALIELEDEMNEARGDLIEQEKTLKVLLNINPLTRIQIDGIVSVGKAPADMVLSELLLLADESRPDRKRSALLTLYHQKAWAYEKAQRIPDLSISVNYDRYGGVWKNFFGIGVSIDLPFLNRNQGNIRSARYSLEQSRSQAELQLNVIRHEVTAAYSNYVNSYAFYEKIRNNSLLPELDALLDVYAKNLLNRNISMLEYLDFIEAYKTNKKTLLGAEKKTNMQFEELQYLVGADIK